MVRIFASLGVLLASAQSALASGQCSREDFEMILNTPIEQGGGLDAAILACGQQFVPELSPMAGMAAVAVVGALLAFAWERRRALLS